MAAGILFGSWAETIVSIRGQQKPKSQVRDEQIDRTQKRGTFEGIRRIFGL